MLDRRRLANEAVYRALSIRKRLSIALDEAMSPVDGAEALGIEVRLVDLPSMEGIYVAGRDPTILLSTLRPAGRRHFTCAHEIGHHIFEHGEQFDEIANTRRARRAVDPREFIADCFASYLLMPKVAIDGGMSRRRFSYASLAPREAYAMSSWLGVGYTTFVNHLQYGLRVITREQSDHLRRFAPQGIRSDILGFPLDSPLHIVDQNWVGRAVDCAVGDYLLVPSATLCEGHMLRLDKTLANGHLVAVKAPGIGRVSGARPLWGAFVRAHRARYVGRARYRFDEEIEE